MFLKEGQNVQRPQGKRYPEIHISWLLQLERQAGVTNSYLHLTQEKPNL